jgi:hypothetical protein
MAISQDGSGFTVVDPEVGSRLIYVANGGSDGNSGLSAGSPKATPQAGANLLRSGYPDQLLFNRGDTFTGGIALNNSGGAGSTTPWLIGTYGTGARPIIKPPAGTNGISMEGGLYQHIYIIGLDFYAEARDPGAGTPAVSSGMVGVRYANAYGSNVWVEDCVMRYFVSGATIEGTSSSAYLAAPTIRRNIFCFNYRNASSHGQGLYMNYCSALTITQNVFDANGWISYDSNTTRDQFCHNVYINTENVGTAHSFTENISARAASHGLQFRRGGTVTDNAYSDNPIGSLYGGGNTPVAGGVPITSARNAVIRGIDGYTALGWGMDFSNINAGTSTDDLVANGTVTSNAHGFNLDNTTANVAFTRRIAYNWRNPFVTDPSASFTDAGGVSLSDLAGNLPNYSDPSRDFGTYYLSLGEDNSTALFLSALRARGIGSWDSNYSGAALSTYLRGGFTATPATTVQGGGAALLLLL